MISGRFASIFGPMITSASAQVLILYEATGVGS
jgi:hypothetical protein